MTEGDHGEELMSGIYLRKRYPTRMFKYTSAAIA